MKYKKIPGNWRNLKIIMVFGKHIDLDGNRKLISDFFNAKSDFIIVHSENTKVAKVKNFLHHEIKLAEMVDHVVILPESPGSLVEFGSFMLSLPKEKLTVVHLKKHKTEKSYIQDGPIAYLEQNRIKRFIRNKNNEKVATFYRNVFWLKEEKISQRELDQLFSFVSRKLKYKKPKAISGFNVQGGENKKITISFLSRLAMFEISRMKKATYSCLKNKMLESVREMLELDQSPINNQILLEQENINGVLSDSEKNVSKIIDWVIEMMINSKIFVDKFGYIKINEKIVGDKMKNILAEGFIRKSGWLSNVREFYEN